MYWKRETLKLNVRSVGPLVDPDTTDILEYRLRRKMSHRTLKGQDTTLAMCLQSVNKKKEKRDRREVVEGFSPSPRSLPRLNGEKQGILLPQPNPPDVTGSLVGPVTLGQVGDRIVLNPLDASNKVGAKRIDGLSLFFLPNGTDRTVHGHSLVDSPVDPGPQVPPDSTSGSGGREVRGSV